MDILHRMTPKQRELLDALQQHAFGYFVHKSNAANGLVRDKGFYYHFLDMTSGRRAWRSELSSVDSAFLFAGMLAAAAFFRRQTAEEDEIRRLADALYRKADWRWMQNGAAAVSHGWTPESGTDVARAQTIAFSAMVAFEWFQALNARSQRLSVFSIGLFSNRWLLLGVGTAVLLQLGVVHTAIGHRLLGTTGLAWMDWLLIVLVASTIWVADEILKWLAACRRSRVGK